jgi:hypothetical protein
MEADKAPAWDRIAELDKILPQAQSQTVPLVAYSFVSEARINELRTLTSPKYDLRKLVRLCEEINIAYGGGALLATAMLMRAILDHVPPIFGMSKFIHVASNYSGYKSFKETMESLENSARKIADGYLHGPIRSKEILPEVQQVNFSAQVDALLAEIVRILS